MKQVFADIYKSYIKLYEYDPGTATDHEVREISIPENPDGTGRVYVGLCLATCKDIWGVGIITALSLDDIRENFFLAQQGAMADIDSKMDEKSEDIKFKNCEYLICPVKKIPINKRDKN